MNYRINLIILLSWRIPISCMDLTLTKPDEAFLKSLAHSVSTSVHHSDAIQIRTDSLAPAALTRYTGTGALEDSPAIDELSAAYPASPQTQVHLERLRSFTAESFPELPRTDRSQELIAALNLRKYSEALTLLQEGDALIDTPDENGWTAFLHACSHVAISCTRDVITVFLNRNDIHINGAQAKDGLTPLRAVGFDDLRLLQILIERGAEALTPMADNTTIFDELTEEWRNRTIDPSTALTVSSLLMQARDIRKLAEEMPRDPRIIKIIGHAAWQAEMNGDLDQQVINEIRRGSSATDIEKLFTHKYDVTKKCIEHPEYTAFDYALLLKRNDIQEILTKRKSDRSPELIAALQAKNIGLVYEILADQKSGIDSPDETGWTPFLHACSAFGKHPTSLNAHIVEEFLKRSLQVNWSTSTGYTPLQALPFCEPAIIGKLVEKGATALRQRLEEGRLLSVFDNFNKHFRQIKETTLNAPVDLLPLLEISDQLMKARDVVELLKTNPTSARAICLIGSIALKEEMLSDPHQTFINAIRRSEDIAAIKTCMPDDADITAPCVEHVGWDAFFYAVAHSRLDIIELLIAFGYPLQSAYTRFFCTSPITTITQQQDTCLTDFEVETHEIVEIGNSEVKELLTRYFNLATHSSTGNLSLFTQEWSQAPQLCITVRFQGSKTLLHLACSCSNPNLDLVCYLVENLNAPINLTDSEGLTPLALAVLGNHEKLIKYLILHGASYRAALSGLREQAARRHLLYLAQLEDIYTKALTDEATLAPSALLTALEQELNKSYPQYLSIAAIVECLNVNQAKLIHRAIRSFDRQLFQIVSSKNEFDPNLRTTNGLTPLLLVFSLLETDDYTESRKRFVQHAVRTLLNKKGIDVQAKDQWGLSAHDKAVVLDPELDALLCEHT